MQTPRSWLNRFLALWRSEQIRNEIEEELRFHVDRRIEANIAAGMSPDKARRDALRRFGPPTRIAEDGYDVRGARWLEFLVGDVRYAARLLLKNKGFTAVAAVTLALGVGINTAIFGVIHGIVLRRLPFKDPGQIVILRQQLQRAGIPEMSFSVSELNDYRQENRSLSAVVEYFTDQLVLEDRDSTERVQTGIVSAGFFDFFGVTPILGRSFLPSDEQPGAPPTLLLSHEYWQRSHNGNREIVGRTVRINGRLHTVIGVLPSIPQYPDDNDVYMTTTSSTFRMWPERIANRNRRFARAFARVRPGVTLQEVNNDLSVVANHLQQQYPASYPPQWGYRTVAIPLSDELTGRARSTLWVLAVAAGFVLLIACANVTNLTLARLCQRERELMLRFALGASRSRLFRQLVTESLLLGLLAAVLGFLLAVASHTLLVEFVARLTPRAREISIDGTLLVFALSGAVSTTVIAGALPALSLRNKPVSNLKDLTGQVTAGPGQRRIRYALIVIQVAFSLSLLNGAGLLLRSFINLHRVDPGIVPEGVLTMHLDFSTSRYPTPADQRTAGREIVNKIQTLPGVVSAAVSSSFPLDPDAIAFGIKGAWNRYQIENEPAAADEPLPWNPIRLVSTDYFKTLQIPIIQGRTFLSTDREGAVSVVVINEAFARHRLGGKDPIGTRISSDKGKTWLTIVGVVGNTAELGLEESESNEVYFPLDQLPYTPSGDWVRSLLVRTAVDPMSLAGLVRKIVEDAAPQTAVSYLMPLDNARKETLASPRVMTSLLGLFAGLALVVAATGIGGILALSINQHRKEIGIRLALGAEPREVLRMVVRQGMMLVLGGIACGLVVTVAMIGPLKAFLFQVAPSDPFTVGWVCVLFLATALMACYIPARRASGINPLVALRHD